MIRNSVKLLMMLLKKLRLQERGIVASLKEPRKPSLPSRHLMKFRELESGGLDLDSILAFYLLDKLEGTNVIKEIRQESAASSET